jgi:hypothetical protein
VRSNGDRRADTAYLIVLPGGAKRRRRRDYGTTALEISKRAVDLGGEEIEV